MRNPTEPAAKSNARITVLLQFFKRPLIVIFILISIPILRAQMAFYLLLSFKFSFLFLFNNPVYFVFVSI